MRTSAATMTLVRGQQLQFYGHDLWICVRRSQPEHCYDSELAHKIGLEAPDKPYGESKQRCLNDNVEGSDHLPCQELQKVSGQ